MLQAKTKIYGITGGIGSGKSYVCRLLEARGIPVFYCDDEAKRLIRTSIVLRQQLSSLIAGVYDDRGHLVKPILAAYLCKGGKSAQQVNQIVHPHVREAFKQWVNRHEGQVVAMECALLFEAGFDNLVQVSVLIHAGEQTRLQRVMARDHISEVTARRWMSLQWDESEKIKRANFIIENENNSDLARQIEQMLCH